jgi:Flp pilus assembly protein TadG
MKRQRGLTTVEFAIVGGVLMIMLFACLEFGRAMYTGAMLNEGTRRAARLAAVCPINDPVIKSAVNFAGLNGFTDANVSLNYLDANGASLGAAPAVVNVYYIRVQVTGFTIPLAIPYIMPTITSPAYPVTVPAESLGISDAGVSTAC